MGAFYGSIHVRGNDRDQTIRVVERVARDRAIRCLAGPMISGWIGVYPEEAGQDQTVGEAIAANLDADVLHLLVHDDDVMAYWLWRSGKQVDSYWSKPGYFGEDDLEAQRAMIGCPDIFDWLSRDQIKSLRRLLDRDGVVFESERLEAFARLLNIPNTATSYEYLKDGETEGIRGWNRFKELPAARVAEARKAGRERRKRINALKKHLKASGQLLCEAVGKDVIPRACALGEGMAVAWADHRSGKQALEHYVSPWRKPEMIPVDLTPQVNSIASDVEGRRVVAALGDRVVVWSNDPWRVLREVHETDWAISAAVSPDGRLLAHACRDEVVVRELERGEVVMTLAEKARNLIFHPSGRWLASIRPDGGLGIAQVDQQGTGSLRALWAGGAQVPGSDKWIERQQRAFEASVKEQIEREVIQRTQGLSEQDRDRVVREAIELSDGRVQELIAEAGKEFASLSDGRRFSPVPEEPLMGLAFSPDGRWLCGGTNKGFRAYDWKAVVEAEDHTMPEPIWRHGTEPGGVSSFYDSYVYGIAVEPDGSDVLFAGLEGLVYRMDLTRIFHQF